MSTRVWMVIGLIGVSSTSGCKSLDPRPVIAQSAATVLERTGILPAWLGPKPDAAFPDRLDESTAVAMALRHDARLLQELQRIAEARADLVQSGLLPNPVLAIDLGFPIDGSGGATKIGVGLTAQLTALLTRSDRISAADSELRARVLECSERALETAAHARAAHARVVFAQSALGPVREAAEEAQHAVDQSRQRVAAGEDTSLEVNRQRLLLAKLTTELAERQSTLETRKRELLARVGWAQHAASFEVVDGARESRAPATEEEVIDLAQTQRLDVAAAREAARAALHRLSAERKSRLDFGAGANFERTDDGRRELGPSVTVGLPIFDWGDARIAKADAEIGRLVLEAGRVEQDAVLEARIAFIAERTAREQLGRYEGDVGTLAATNLDLARRAFGAGQADLTVLLEAQQQRAEARVKIVELRERAALARIELERAVGGRLK